MHVKRETAVVCGGGGFIGGHRLKHLLAGGVDVIRPLDTKPLDDCIKPRMASRSWFSIKEKHNRHRATLGADVVVQLASHIGGMRSLRTHRSAQAQCSDQHVWKCSPRK